MFYQFHSKILTSSWQNQAVKNKSKQNCYLIRVFTKATWLKELKVYSNWQVFPRKQFQCLPLCVKLLEILNLRTCLEPWNEAIWTLFICLPVKYQLIKIAKNNSKFLKDLELPDTGCSDNSELLPSSEFYCALLTGIVKKGKAWSQLTYKVNSVRFEIVPYPEKMFLLQILVL